MNAALEWAEGGDAAIGLVLGLIALIGLVARPMVREARENRRFQRTFREDWIGTEGRPGVPGRPGVMTTLLDLRTDAVATADRVRRLEQQHKHMRQDVAWILTHCPGCADRGINPLEDEEG